MTTSIILNATFDLIDHRGYLIADCKNRNVLIDTGCPFSISETPEWKFLGVEHKMSERQKTLLENIEYLKNPAVREQLSFTAEVAGIMEKAIKSSPKPQDYSKYIGYDIDLVLGADYFDLYNVLIDYRAKKVTFDAHSLTLKNGIEMDLQKIDEDLVATIELTMKRKKRTFLLDTGSKISYVSPKLTWFSSKLGEIEDFHPQSGIFKTPIYETEMKIADQEFNAVVGVLPKNMQQECEKYGIENILGVDLFKSFKTVISFKEKKIWLEKYD